ncbi:MAG: amino acid ABC transporter permease [Alphaproteobacteria bacterium]|nr:amino acid ABC transporter permease [Alphaproteobacteria bacterium]
MSFDLAILTDNWRLFADGLGLTVLICAIALPLGFVLGIGLALLRLSRRGVLVAAAIGYVELIRNIPFLIQIFLVFFGLPFFGIRLDPLPLAIVALAVYGSAYFSEVVRGAILSVPRGQGEAARALGLRPAMVFRKVIFPQMLGYLIPASTNLTITLIKESAVLSVITVAELTYMSQFIIGRTFAPVEVFTAISLLYWGFTGLVAGLMSVLERRATRFARLSETTGPLRRGRRGLAGGMAKPAE